MITEFINTWRNHITYRLYLVILLLLLVKQWVFYTEMVDSSEFLAAASNLLNTGFPDSCIQGKDCDHWLHETRRSVGYPVLLLLSGMLRPLILAIQVILAALIPLLTIRLAGKLGIGEKSNRVILWFFLFYPLQFYYPSLLMPEVWCQLLVLYTVISALDQKWLGTAAGFSALLLLKPVFIIGLPLLILWLLKAPAKRWVLSLPMAIFLLISLWNQSKTGVFHFSSIGVENFWEYNQRAVLNRVMTDQERDRFYQNRDSVLASMNFSGRYRYLDTEAKRIVKSHWKLYAWLHVKGCFLALADPGRYDMMAFFGLKSTSGFMGIKESGSISNIFRQPWPMLSYIMIFLTVNILKWLLVLRAFISGFKKYWYIWVILGIFISVTGPVGSARYVFPLMPLVILMAAQGWDLLRKKYEKDSVTQR